MNIITLSIVLMSVAAGRGPVVKSTRTTATKKASSKSKVEPKAEEKKVLVPAKAMPFRIHKLESDAIAYKLRVSPELCEVKQSVTLTIELAEKLKSQNSAFGNQKPINDAEVVAVLVPPRTKKAKAEPVRAHRAVRLRDSGSYSVSFRPQRPGIYTLHLTGSASGESLSMVVPVAVGTWPMPEEPRLTALPKRLPSVQDGDRDTGRALCEKHCKKDLAFAHPAGKTPTFLETQTAAALGDTALLNSVLAIPSSRLTPAENLSLIAYLRSLHSNISSIFPDASHKVAGELEIPEFGLERLAKHGIKLDGQAQKVSLFVVYQAEGHEGPMKSFALDDAVGREEIDRKSKVGYVAFVPWDADHEVMVALEKEPEYQIKSVVVRNRRMQSARKLESKLKRYRGMGRFDDAKSLRGGEEKLRKKMVKAYLLAAEVATTFYGIEREDAAFEEAL